MGMAVAQPCPCSSYVFFTQQQSLYLHNLIHFQFCPIAQPHLHRRFSSYAAGDSSSSCSRRRRSNKWDPNAETIRAKGFNTQNYDDEEEDGDEELGSSGILKEALDSIWILKVFKSYGWTLPPILFSLLFATGPKAFLMALALPLGQSVVTFAFEKLLRKSRGKQKPKARARKKRKDAYQRTVKNVRMEKEVREGQRSRKETKNYQSWVVGDDGSVNGSDDSAPSFGGWDELDEMGTLRTSSTMASGLKRTTKEKSKMNMDGSKSNEPLLLRLLIAVFPFLSSWTKLFW